MSAKIELEALREMLEKLKNEFVSKYNDIIGNLSVEDLLNFTEDEVMEVIPCLNSRDYDSLAHYKSMLAAFSGLKGLDKLITFIYHNKRVDSECFCFGELDALTNLGICLGAYSTPPNQDNKSPSRIILEVYAQYFFSEILKLPGLTFNNVREFVDNKTSGEQQYGAIAIVVYQNQADQVFQAIKFFIKTHDGGTSCPKGLRSQPLDPREVFVYKYLELIGLGAQVAYFFDLTDFNNFYISSREVEAGFTTFRSDVYNETFLNNFNKNPQHIMGLVWVELAGKILLLSDNYNLSNFGFLRSVSTFENIRIIDFKICDNYIINNQDMLDCFLKENISLESKIYMPESAVNLFKIPLEDKCRLAKQIMQSKFDSLTRSIDLAVNETRDFFEKSQYRDKLKQKYVPEFDKKQQNFDIYIDKVRENLAKFNTYLSSVN